MAPGKQEPCGCHGYRATWLPSQSGMGCCGVLGPQWDLGMGSAVVLGSAGSSVWRDGGGVGVGTARLEEW